MASIKQDLMQRHRELKPLIDIYERYAYRHGYYQVFSDFVDFCVHKYSYPTQQDDYKLPRYITQPDNAPHDFINMLDIVIGESHKRCGIYNKAVQSWYDPFGSFFETVASDFGKSYRGQFFTPEPICDLMADKIGDRVGGRVNEPTCGSGRMVLAMNAINPGKYYVANDIDALCVKMCAVNFCLNGVVGEINCNDGLMPTKENFRFAYRCVPLSILPIAQNGVFKAWAFMSEKIEKMYCLLPLSFEESGYTIDVAKQEADKMPKMNTLFDIEQTLKSIPKPPKSNAKAKPQKGGNNNLSLF
jgi:type I restriction enzyme M protein